MKFKFSDFADAFYFIKRVHPLLIPFTRVLNLFAFYRKKNKLTSAFLCSVRIFMANVVITLSKVAVDARVHVHACMKTTLTISILILNDVSRKNACKADLRFLNQRSRRTLS